MHENTQAFSQAGIRDCCSSWTALVKSETSTELPRLDTQQYHPTLDCQICVSVLLNSHSLHCTLPSFNLFFFLTTKVCLNKETLLASNVFYGFFPLPPLALFPAEITLTCNVCSVWRNFPLSQLIPPHQGFKSRVLCCLPLALQPRLKRGGSKRLWINNANSNGGVMNVHY